MKLLLSSLIEDEPRLPEEVELVRYRNNRPIPDEHLDAEILVDWGNGADMLAHAAKRLTRLRWVQTLSAGPDLVVRAGFALDVLVTGGVGLHDQPVSEHALALILALVRELPQAAAAQARHEWSRALGGPRPLHPEGRITTLLGARVVIWGFGSIGVTLAGLLAALGAEVTGVARSAGARGGYPVVAEDALDDALAGADLLVMVLPSAPETEGALSAERLALLPAHALVVNVGRGSTVDEVALVGALESGRLAGAGLDVTGVEPLPADSPLWDAPNVLITPHAAGGRPVGSAALIEDNVRRLLAGDPLRNVVSH